MMVTTSVSEAIMENKEAYETYLASLSDSNFDELTSEEISSLFTEPMDPNAVDIVVQSKMRYAIKLAWKMFPYAKWRIDVSDLISAANYGLYQSALHFNPEKGTFNSYAYLWIRKMIYDFAAKNHAVNHSHKSAIKLKREDCVSVDLEYCDSEVQVDSGENASEAALICEKAMKHLSQMQREYIKSYYLEDNNICDIAKEYHVSHQAVSQSIRTGLAKVREILNIDLA